MKWFWDAHEDAPVDHSRRRFIFLGAAAGLVATVAPKLILDAPKPVKIVDPVWTAGALYSEEKELNNLIYEVFRNNSHTLMDTQG